MKGVFPPHHVADATEHQGTERPNQEAGSIGRERRQQGSRVVSRGKEQRRKEWRKRRVKVEVVPFEHGAERGGEYHLALFPRRDHHPTSDSRHSIGCNV